MSGQHHLSQAHATAAKRIHLAAIVIVAIGGGLLTACGGSSGGTAAPGGGQGTTSSGGGGSASDGIGHPVSVCTLLPAATAASQSGLAITVATEGDTPNLKSYTCSYSSADGTQGFEIGVLGLDAAMAYASDLQSAGSSAQPLSGLGDKAFASSAEVASGSTVVEALFGNVAYEVTNLDTTTTTATASAAEAVIKYLQPKI